MVAHEMRNPLNAIIQCADIIQSCLTDVPEDVRQHESIQEIVENARTVMHCAMHQKVLHSPLHEASVNIPTQRETF